MRLLKNIEFIEQFVWTDQSIQIFKLVGDLGLLFLLFMVGLELDLLELNSKFKDSVVVAVFVLAITFSLSLAVSHFLARAFVIDSNYLLFVLYLGIACSSTALPVLARQLSELNLSHSVLIINPRGLESWGLLVLVLSAIC